MGAPALSFVFNYNNEIECTFLRTVYAFCNTIIIIVFIVYIPQEKGKEEVHFTTLLEAFNNNDGNDSSNVTFKKSMCLFHNLS